MKIHARETGWTRSIETSDNAKYERGHMAQQDHNDFDLPTPYVVELRSFLHLQGSLFSLLNLRVNTRL